jgi:hypothetical protein
VPLPLTLQYGVTVSRHEIEDKKVIATAESMHNLALINESAISGYIAMTLGR